MDKFKQALQHLLPSGFAWPRYPDSVLMRVLHGIAASFGELDAFIARAADEWLPQRTSTRLEEWEEAVGLPDACLGVAQTVAQRRALVLSRLRGASGFYADSSPASPGSIEAICLNMGYPAQVRYNTPFRCGRDRCGDRLGQLDGRLHIILHVGDMLFRVGVNRVGDRLEHRPPEAEALACYLQRYVPARFQLIVIFQED